MPNQQINNEVSDEAIVSFFAGRNKMHVDSKKVSPKHVPDGGYWLNGVEVDVRQLIDAYKEYTMKVPVVMSR